MRLIDAVEKSSTTSITRLVEMGEMIIMKEQMSYLSASDVHLFANREDGEGGGAAGANEGASEGRRRAASPRTRSPGTPTGHDAAHMYNKKIILQSYLSTSMPGDEKATNGASK